MDIDKSTASKLINQGQNLPKVIRNALRNPKTSDELLILNFEKNIIPELNSNKIESLVNELKNQITKSSEISLENKDYLSHCIDDKKYGEFLALSFKYTLNINNKKKSILQSDEEIESEKPQKSSSSPQIDIPTEIRGEEQPYITAIIDAISEKEQQKMSLEAINTNKRYKERLTRHRTEYFSADYVRRQSRELYDENEDPFDDLQEELKDGIIYTVEKTNYENGYERLIATLEQAAQVQIDSNQLVKETDLVNIKAKQGLCHTLINDKKLEGWTNDKYN